LGVQRPVQVNSNSIDLDLVALRPLT